jgi:hypothetical protein
LWNTDFPMFNFQFPAKGLACVASSEAAYKVPTKRGALRMTD